MLGNLNNHMPQDIGFTQTEVINNFFHTCTSHFVPVFCYLTTILDFFEIRVLWYPLNLLLWWHFLIVVIWDVLSHTQSSHSCISSLPVAGWVMMCIPYNVLYNNINFNLKCILMNVSVEKSDLCLLLFQWPHTFNVLSHD